MSKPSNRKKARRQNRLARKVVWERTSPLSDQDLEIDDELVAQANALSDAITPRGWIFDAEHSIHGLASWYFAPSGFEPDDDETESVTRVWFTLDGNPDEMYVIFAGTGVDVGAQRVSPQQFLEAIDVIEAHRAETPMPALG